MECVSCRAVIGDDSKFCSSCGAPMARRCPGCGHINPSPAKFCSQCGVRLDGGDPTSGAAGQRAAEAPADTAERRQVTVLFCDLVGSTALSNRLDPEDLREVITAYHRRLADVVDVAGGFVAKYMGDGALVYFGYPRAHEDDAERAVRAGLALTGAVRNLAPAAGVPLSCRIGIATGLVVIGDLIGQGAAQEHNVIGETPNLAARLQALAEPGTVVIAARTQRLIGNLFECRDLGQTDVKGFVVPVRAYQVTGMSGIESRSEALHEDADLAPLIGRGEEIAALLRRWRSAKEGDGQVALIAGEPGIGKSRLAAALDEHIRTEDYTRIRLFCSPHHRDSPLHPFTAYVQRAAGFARDDAPETKLDKLTALLAHPGEDTSVAVALMAELLGIGGGSAHAASALSPQQKRERALMILHGLVRRAAASRPVLMVFEDAHWSDPSSRTLLDTIIDGAPQLHMLVIITFRPEFQAPWVGEPHVTIMVLNRLSRREEASIVERVVGAKALPPEILEQIIARTDGVPLFVEELTKAVLESGQLREHDNRYTVDRTLPVSIPSTLHASLLARLDRLALAKEAAQIGAAIGRDFSYELLAAVARRGEGEIKGALDQLVKAGLVFRHGTMPNATFTFKHALVQDAAYTSLLKSRRQQLHARIAQALEEHFPEIVTAQPELVARHYTDAGMMALAIDYWERAGRQAAERSANAEAVAHFQRAIEILDGLPDRAARSEQEMRILIACGPVLMLTRTSAAPEVSEVYTRASDLARRTGRSAELFPTLWGTSLIAVSRGDVSTGSRLNDELFGIARTQSDRGLLLQAHHAAFPVARAQGDFAASWRHAQATLELYDRDAHRHHAQVFGGHDPATCAYATGAIVRTVAGSLDGTIDMATRGLEHARALNHRPSIAHGLMWSAELHELRREPEEVESLIDIVLPMLDKNASAVGLANSMMLRGWARVAAGRTADGIGELREGLAAWRSTGSGFHVPHRLGRSADGFRLAGIPDEALRLVDEGLAAATRSGDLWYTAELHRLKGELLRMTGGDPQDVAGEFEAALRVATRQGARLFELRATTALARLEAGHGGASTALTRLSALTQSFADGAALRDVAEAREILAHR